MDLYVPLLLRGSSSVYVLLIWKLGQREGGRGVLETEELIAHTCQVNVRHLTELFIAIYVGYHIFLSNKQEQCATNNSEGFSNSNM